MGSGDPRGAFMERFTLLYAEAGDPPLKRVAETIARARRVDQDGRPVRVSVQRISDWRRGRSVPARFPGFAAVLEILIGEARKQRPTPRIPGLYDLNSWRSLWEVAASGTALAEPDVNVCPYRGLAPFRREDSDWYFGREQVTQDLFRMVEAARETGGTVMVVGASGAGKSSLLKAGLMPLLGDDVEYVTPGAELELAEAPVLIVDQFEELFTLTADQDARQDFVARLRETSERAVVVIGVRADFYGHCLAHPELVEALQDRQLVLGPMAQRQLREAITAPAKAVGLHLEPGLVEVLQRDLGTDAGALPLLSHALLGTWKRRQGNRLTIAGYRATGGIHGAVAATAERVWSRLDEPGRRAARAMLLRLVRIDKDGKDTRRRTTRDDLAGSEAAAAALEILAASRLVTLDAGSVEITHEALLRAWPRLRNWLDEDREAILARQRVDEDAEAWARAGHDPSLLYRGARLATVRGWVSADSGEATRAFLARSERQDRRVRWARRSGVAVVLVFALIAALSTVVVVRQRDEARYAHLVSAVERVAGTDPSLAARLNLAAAALRPEDQNAYARTISAQHALFTTRLDGHRGAIRAVTASGDGRLVASASEDETVRLWDPVTRSPIGEPLTGHGDAVMAAALSQDGRLLATGGSDGKVRLWDVSEPARPRPIGQPLVAHTSTVSSVALSPDGKTLVSGGDSTRIWDLTAPVPVSRELKGHSEVVRAVAISPDGTMLVTASSDHTARLWDVASAAPVGKPLIGHTGRLWSVAFSADSATLATGSDDESVRLWSTRDQREIGQPLTGHASAVMSVAFSEDGGHLITASTDKVLRRWDISAPLRPRGEVLSGSSGVVYAVVTRAAGNVLVTGGEDAALRFWAQPPGLLTGHTASVHAAAIRSSDYVLATAGEDLTVRLWDARDPLHPKALGQPLTGHTGVVRSAAFVPGSRLLATSGDDRRVVFWDVSDPANARLAAQLDVGGGETAWKVAFSPDGRTMATAVYGKDVRLWDTTDPLRPRSLGGVHEGAVWADFDPRGGTLVTSGPDRTVRLWDMANPAAPKQLGQPLTEHTGPVWTGAFSPDGRSLATSASDRTIRLWDITDRLHPRPGPVLTRHGETTTGVAFSPDGRRLAASGSDHVVRIWNLDTGDRLTFTGHHDLIWSVIFSPDGRSLATTSSDGSARLWTLDAGRVADRVCAQTRGVLTPELWRETVPQLPYTDPCSR
ncbi:nSTAND1 domain-containing NTPase [Allokutzneria albata]|uniref:WD40 repeat n=1 Tax=Allokutzneria albata TaxID=211114 RepID=A0A1H0DN49_ALLAB|nr:WD40 repeat domain-containing protein [Allokutzneria albata]SDN71466.1 WD40 repeat [Allokutzneria albata]